MADVSIFWDYENCPAPTNTSGCGIVNSLRSLAKPYGSVKSFRAYLTVSDLLSTARATTLRSELQASGVSLIDCPHNGRKEVADKMIIGENCYLCERAQPTYKCRVCVSTVDMLAYAIDNPAPATVILISGDRDFAYALSILRLRRYRVVLVTLPNAHSSLTAQASTCILYSDVLNKTGQLPNNYLSPTMESVFQGLQNAGEGDVHRTDKGDLVRYLHNITERRSLAEMSNTPYKNQNQWLKQSPDPDIVLSPFPRLVPEYNSVEPPQPRADTVERIQLPTSTSIHDSTRTSHSADAVKHDMASDIYNNCTTQSECLPLNTKQSDNLLNTASGENSRRTSLAVGNYKQARLLDESQVVHCYGAEPSKDESLSSITLLPRQVSATSTAQSTIAIVTATPPSTVCRVGASTETGNYASKEATTIGMLPKLEANGKLLASPQSQVSEHKSVAAPPHQEVVPTYGGPVTSLDVPPIFRVLVKSLQAHRARGVPRPLRSLVALGIAKNGVTYQKAGVSKFRDYVALAVDGGIVQLGGKEATAWISLKPEWFDANVGDP